jgi:hypothetical protein
MAALFCAGLVVESAALSADVLTQHNNNSRTGANVSETTLTTTSVAPDRFGKLWTLYADGQIVAQPLYVSQLAVDTTSNPATPAVKGTFNAVLIVTMHNTVYLYDADKENPLPDGKTKPLWATWLGQARPGGKDIDMWSTNDPEWGIVSTPVIDPARTTVWVVAWHNEGGAFRYRLHALNLKDGAERRASTVIGGIAPDPTQPCKFPNAFNPCTQKQRAALLLSQGTLYAAFGGDGNRGSVFAFDANTLQQRAVWFSTPTGDSGGIWQSGQGPAADAQGSVYLITGNGTFDANTGGHNFGDSFVRLELAGGSLQVGDSFTPCNQDFMRTTDLDLGAGGAVLIPGSGLLYGGGKEGVIYLLSRTNMGKYSPGAPGQDCKNPNSLQEFQATDLHNHGAGTIFGHIHSSPVLWSGPDAKRIYVWGENDHLKAFRFVQDKFVDLTNPKLSTYRPPDGMPGGMLSVSSDRQTVGTGIVWAVVPLNGDANKNRGVQGIVLALDAQDISRELWTSERSGQRDHLGLFAKYTPPTIAGGKVFVATYGDQEQLRIWGGGDRPPAFPGKYYVAVYGPLPHGPHPRAIVNQDSDDVTVLSASATEPMSLDTASCQPAASGAVDCTLALAQKFGAPGFHQVIVSSGYNFAGCMLLRVTTASKVSGLSDASGIGWYAADATPGSQAMSSGRFITKADLKPPRAATLKSGAPAALQDFVGIANCSADTVSLDKTFKPYMQFDNSTDGRIYRNWDVGGNYRISRAASQLDRGADVLAQQ